MKKPRHQKSECFCLALLRTDWICKINTFRSHMKKVVNLSWALWKGFPSIMPFYQKNFDKQDVKAEQMSVVLLLLTFAERLMWASFGARLSACAYTTGREGMGSILGCCSSSTLLGSSHLTLFSPANLIWFTDIPRYPLNVASWSVWDSTFWIFVFLNDVQADPSVSEVNSGLG